MSGTFRRRLGWGLMTFSALIFALFQARYATFDTGVAPDFLREAYAASSPWIFLHVLPGVLAMAIGPFQFLPGLRTKRWLPLHKVLGRIYLVACCIGGVGALVLALDPFGGLPTGLGLATLGVLWILCAVMGFRAVRGRRIEDHRRWMIRSYALTFAIVFFRLELALLQISGLDTESAFRICAWTSWMITLGFAEMLLLRRGPAVAHARSG